MSRPTTPMVQFAGLLAWLTGEGITENHVRKLITTGAIPRAKLPGRERAYYEVSKVAAVLQITDPFQTTTTHP